MIVTIKAIPAEVNAL